MDHLRIIPVTNDELVLSVSAMADEIWHEHYDKLVGQEQVDYMLEKFLSPDALTRQIAEEDYEYFLISYDYTFAGFSGIREKDGFLFLSKLYIQISVKNISVRNDEKIYRTFASSNLKSAYCK